MFQARLTTLFKLLDTDQDDLVSLLSLQSAFLMFARGSKSDKLITAFHLFDSDSGAFRNPGVFFSDPIFDVW